MNDVENSAPLHSEFDRAAETLPPQETRRLQEEWAAFRAEKQATEESLAARKQELDLQAQLLVERLQELYERESQSSEKATLSAISPDAGKAEDANTIAAGADLPLLRQQLAEHQQAISQLQSERDAALTRSEQLLEQNRQFEQLAAEQDTALAQIRELQQPESRWFIDPKEVEVLGELESQVEVLRQQASQYQHRIVQLEAERAAALQSRPVQPGESAAALNDWAEVRLSLPEIKVQLVDLSQAACQLTEEQKQIELRRTDLFQQANYLLACLQKGHLQLEHIAGQLENERRLTEKRRKSMDERDAEMRLGEAEFREMKDIVDREIARERNELNQERLRVARQREALRHERQRLAEQDSTGLTPEEGALPMQPEGLFGPLRPTGEADKLFAPTTEQGQGEAAMHVPPASQEPRSSSSLPDPSTAGSSMTPETTDTSGVAPPQVLPASSPSSAVSTGPPAFEQRRRSPRRTGNPIPVLITEDITAPEQLRGWVVDRSVGGLRLWADHELPVGTGVYVRSTKAMHARWIKVKVRWSLVSSGLWNVGCEFTRQHSWTELEQFG